jgi:rSAM/selenodomain-associated transferase 1
MSRGLIIFVKNAEPGKVKTRLAISIGDEAALAVYKRLLQYTRAITSKVNARRFVFYSSQIEDHDGWDHSTYEKQLQSGKDLGERMANALSRVLLKVDMAVIIGSDCLELTSAIIDDAFAALERFDVVIGPARDGGYYLLGIKQIHPELFADKKWSTSTVFQDTVADLRVLGLTYATLPVLSDIDDIDDLRRSPLGGVLRGK